MLHTQKKNVNVFFNLPTDHREEYEDRVQVSWSVRFVFLSFVYTQMNTHRDLLFMYTTGSCELRTCWKAMPSFREVNKLVRNTFVVCYLHILN